MAAGVSESPMKISGVPRTVWSSSLNADLELTNPAATCHVDLGTKLPDPGITDENDGSNWTWNCGETLPVSRFSTRATDLACVGDLPR